MRLAKIDGLRGLTLISMILYHALWDVVFIFGGNIPWYSRTPGFIWQQSICWTFILLSGFSAGLGKRQLRRGITVFLCGAVISAVTVFFMPEDAVRFGILTFMGSAMLLMVPVERLLGALDGRKPVMLSLAGFFLFILTRGVNRGYILNVRLPEAWYANDLTAFLGFPPAVFFSTDYFPLIPWFFLYLTGYGLYGIMSGGWADNGIKAFLKESSCPPLEFIGRHTLIIYMLHQPVIYGLLTVTEKTLH